jgi:hypothetical protein
MNAATSNVVPLNVKMGIVDQVKEAMRKQNRLATFAGVILGGFVPVASFTLAHFELRLDGSFISQIPTLFIIAAGLTYSAKTVFDWARVAFKHPAKALGFCVLVEGVMTFAHTTWLSAVALALLVTINGVATGCNLALDSKLARKANKK